MQTRPGVGVCGQARSVAQRAKPRRNGHSAFCIHRHPSTRLEPSAAGNQHSHGDVVPIPSVSASCLGKIRFEHGCGIRDGHGGVMWARKKALGSKSMMLR